MTNTHSPLDDAERTAITSSLSDLKARLSQAGELLAAMHIEHALQSLDPENPINRQDAGQA